MPDRFSIPVLPTGMMRMPGNRYRRRKLHGMRTLSTVPRLNRDWGASLRRPHHRRSAASLDRVQAVHSQVFMHGIL